MFQFATATQILFGPGQSASLPQHVARWGTRAFLVTGANAARHTALFESLATSNIECAFFAVAGEPSVSLIQDGVKLARQQQSDVIVALGGGSAVDAGKAKELPSGYVQAVAAIMPVRCPPAEWPVTWMRSGSPPYSAMLR